MDTADIDDHAAGLASGPTPSTEAPAPVVDDPKPPKTPKKTPAPDPKADAIDAVLRRFTDGLRNTPVSRMTEAWNHLTTVSIPALRADLLKDV